MSLRTLGTMVGVLATVAMTLVGTAAARDQYRPDAWITLKAKLALMLADDIHGTDIDVDTINQRVTLHGAVDSETEKGAAERVVRDIEGVADVRNLLEVVPEEARERYEEASERADERIEEQVEDVLDRWDSDGVDVDVESVDHGVVVLDGDVDSMARYVGLIEAVERVDGVRQVESRVEAPNELREPADWRTRDFAAKRRAAREGDEELDDRYDRNPLEDMWLTTAIKTKLLANGDVPALEINVDTWNGEVTLFGVVNSDRAKRAAEADAREVDGVRSVQNELQVVPESAERVTEEKDEDLEDRIEGLLDGREGLDDIEVEVANGVARLTGEADSVAARLSAATLARSVLGVKSVVNDVRLDSDT